MELIMPSICHPSDKAAANISNQSMGNPRETNLQLLKWEEHHGAIQVFLKAIFNHSMQPEYASLVLTVGPIIFLNV
jgi:hypothetical protein